MQVISWGEPVDILGNLSIRDGFQAWMIPVVEDYKVAMRISEK
jgi:hypothetical protein